MKKKKKESWMSCCPKKSTKFTQAFLTFLNDRSVYTILLRRLKNKVSLHKLRKTIHFYRIVWYGAVMPNISFRPRRLGGKLCVAIFPPKADLIFWKTLITSKPLLFGQNHYTQSCSPKSYIIWQNNQSCTGALSQVIPFGSDFLWRRRTSP